MMKHLMTQAVLLVCATVACAQQLPEYVYVGGLQVNGFSVNRSTGVLTAVPGPAIRVTGPIAASPTGHFVFVTFQGITVGKIDRATGALTAVPGSPFASSLHFICSAVTPNGRFLIAVSEESFSSVFYSFSIDEDAGALTLAGAPVSVDGSVTSLVVTPSSKFLYATSESLFLEFSVDPQTGALTLLPQSATGSAAVISADGKYLYAVVSTMPDGPGSTGQIFGYSIDAQTGALTSVPGSPFSAPNTEEFSLAIDPTGRFLYQVANDVGNNAIGIAGFLINSVNGALEGSVPGSPFPITTGYPNNVAVDRSGAFVYAPDSGANLLSEFTVNSATGSLTPFAGTLAEVYSPYNVVVTAPQPPSTAALTALAIQPADPSVDSNITSTEQFTATGIYSDGGYRFLTASVIWSSSNTAVATVSNTPGQTGLATILSDGETVIEATLGGVNGKTTLSVQAEALVSIALTPQSPAVKAGTAVQFTATGTYADGSTRDLTNSVHWKSSSTPVAVVNQSGLAYARVAGSCIIEAISASITASTALRVTSN